jgi:hypothetical protein
VLRRALVILVGALAITTAAPAAANAAAGVDCPPMLITCTVAVVSPGTPAATGGAPAAPAPHTGPMCVIPGTGNTIPCYDDRFGWFNSSDACYYRQRTPQPPANDPAWEGHFPDGAIYVVTCLVPDGTNGTHGGWTWLPTPPPGFGGTAGAEQLAASAVNEMRLTGPEIGLSIGPGQVGLVGVPVWLWTAVSPTTWGPNTATAAIPGLSVTASAQATRIVWNLGDGSTVECANAGTPYVVGGIASPTCGHVYRVSSAGQPGDAFSVTATTTWRVTWSGGGRSGVLTVTHSSSTTVRIGELQVLVTS